MSLVARIVIFAFFLSGCVPSAKKDDVSDDNQHLLFKLAMGNRLLTCEDVQHGIMFGTKRWQIEQLKFYLYQLTFTHADNEAEVELIPSDWQTNQVALLSIEPRLCGDETEPGHAIVQFKSLPLSQNASTLHFMLGVPFEMNHSNPLTQPSPLNLPLMFWSWQLGHKFIRWDMSQAQSSWSFHLGSLGCDSASSVRAPSLPCREPNQVSVSLNKLSPDTRTIWVHLDRLVEGLDLEDDSSCVLHGATENSCATLIQNVQYNEVFEWR